MNRVVANRASQSEHSQDIAILSGGGVRLPVVFELVESVRESGEPKVVLVAGGLGSNSE